MGSHVCIFFAALEMIPTSSSSSLHHLHQRNPRSAFSSQPCHVHLFTSCLSFKARERFGRQSSDRNVPLNGRVDVSTSTTQVGVRRPTCVTSGGRDTTSESDGV
ncbi:hypothetical protein BC629DRAFT_1477698 [Irpex lacteus]|nr:hypothetical protein BC629DRAFT_1477698 [Irpex lacteus]